MLCSYSFRYQWSLDLGFRSFGDSPSERICPNRYRLLILKFRKMQLLLLFCLGFFVVSITVIRMPVIMADKSVQKARTLVCS